MIHDVDNAAAVTCIYCGCDPNNACILEDGAGVLAPCSWFRVFGDELPNGLGVCTNPECVRSYLADPHAP